MPIYRHPQDPVQGGSQVDNQVPTSTDSSLYSMGSLFLEGC